MIRVKSMCGKTKLIPPVVLEQLRMMMDWQIRQLGYDPNSINLNCRVRDEATERLGEANLKGVER